MIFENVWWINGIRGVRPNDPSHNNSSNPFLVSDRNHVANNGQQVCSYDYHHCDCIRFLSVRISAIFTLITLDIN